MLIPVMGIRLGVPGLILCLLANLNPVQLQLPDLGSVGKSVGLPQISDINLKDPKVASVKDLKEGSSYGGPAAVGIISAPTAEPFKKWNSTNNVTADAGTANNIIDSAMTNSTNAGTANNITDSATTNSTIAETANNITDSATTNSTIAETANNITDSATTNSTAAESLKGSLKYTSETTERTTTKKTTTTTYDPYDYRKRRSLSSNDYFSWFGFGALNLNYFSGLGRNDKAISLEKFPIQDHKLIYKINRTKTKRKSILLPRNVLEWHRRIMKIIE